MISKDMVKNIEDCESCMHEDVCKAKTLFLTLGIYTRNTFEKFVKNAPELDFDGVCIASFNPISCKKYKGYRYLGRECLMDDDKKPINNEHIFDRGTI